MSEKIKIKIQNTTDFNLNKSFEESFQMESWDFPDTIKSKETTEVVAVFKTGEDILLSQDLGEVEYETAEKGGHLKIKAFWPCLRLESSGDIKTSPEGFFKFKHKESVTITIS